MTRRLLTQWIPGDSGNALDALLALAGGGLNSAAASTAHSSPTQRRRLRSTRRSRWSDDRDRDSPRRQMERPHPPARRRRITRSCCGAMAPARSRSAARRRRRLPRSSTAGAPLAVDHTGDGDTAGPISSPRSMSPTTVALSPAASRLSWKLGGAPRPLSPIAPEYLFPIADRARPGRSRSRVRVEARAQGRRS